LKLVHRPACAIGVYGAARPKTDRPGAALGNHKKTCKRSKAHWDGTAAALYYELFRVGLEEKGKDRADKAS